MLKTVFALASSFVSLNAFAISANELHSGDILLQPLNCYLCNAIEKVGGSIYSHSGVVVRAGQNSILVLESIGGQAPVTLSEFAIRTQKKQNVRVVRPREFEQSPPSAKALMDEFRQKFSPVVFDHSMRWDNVDASGREPLYCSEFVAKFLSKFMRKPFQTKTMHFAVLHDFWLEFFGGDIPEGEQGIAPSDFLKSPLSEDIGDLELDSLSSRH